MACCGRKNEQKAKRESREILATEQALLRDKKPQADKDGNLTFDGLAPVMKGYIHDPMDMRRLKPDNAPCVDRISMPLLNQDGTYTLFNQCNSIECDKRGQTVDEEICKDCPLRRTPKMLRKEE